MNRSFSAETRLDGLPARLIGAQIAAGGVCAIAYWITGLRLAWTGTPIALPLIVIALLAWAVTRRATATDAALAAALLLSCSLLVLLLQYPAVALGRPMIDATLLRADALFGMSVPALTAWTATHHQFGRVLRAAYDSFAPELAIAVAIVAARRDREALWEFVTEYHLCLGVALAACALWPATQPWTLQHLADLAGQGRAVMQVAGFHEGTLRSVDINQPAGLVGIPSFHVAGAWMAVWAVRRSRLALWILCPLNILLTMATVFLGVHYAMDVVAGFALLAASIALYRVPAALAARLGVSLAFRLRTPRPSSAPLA